LRFSRFFSKLLEMVTVDTANPPQEYPDIVGARPTNPLAANFKPFIPASLQLPELTWPHLITGTILGMVFGASSLYLVLKVGLTVSASIPVAVISITIFRIFSKFGFRDATILQNNIVQTAGSAGDGSTVTKFDAPKATLMSYIIKGILSRKLPWALVLLGVMIAIVLEMSGIPSLAFAVGVYLPLASSSPIFIGGMIRLLVDRYLRVKFRHKNLSDVELIAEGDKSRGVLLASGYIAGGAITGIVIAAKELVAPLAVIGHRIDEWQTAHNPFFNGPNSDLLALIPFLVLCVLLYLVGRDVVLKARPSGGTA